MTFPIINDYRMALRNASGRFATLDVEPILDAKGEPVFMAGNFAAVFKVNISGVNTVVALKFFIRNMPDLEKRHRAIAQTIEQAKARYLIDVGFLANEVFVNSTIAPSGEYPLVMMPWTEGKNLGAVIKRISEKNNRKGLAAITKGWANLCLDMLVKGIAHGDLKHDNVLVTPEGQLRLIDYDSMFTPALRGLHSVLLGGASYQHPRRSIKHFDQSMDHFSMLVITLSLRALTVDPGLHKTFHIGENIILNRDDFVMPGRSELLARLQASPDALVNNWARVLTRVLRSGSIAVPEIKKILRDARNVPVALPQDNRVFSSVTSGAHATV